MDGGYVLLFFLLGFIALMILWLVGGVSPLMLLRSVFGDADIMSSFDAATDQKKAVVPPVDQQTTIAKQPIATTYNAGNSPLSDNSLSAEEARDIIRFQAKVEALAALIRDGQVTNKARGIERVFGCSRSSKEDSVYQRALKALDPLVTTGPKFPSLTPEQQAAREALGLAEH